MDQVLVNSLLDDMTARGFVPGTEQRDICTRVLQFQGYSYLRSEELATKETIDCSTLVSQSHWEGAAIGIPFVAENQRTASSGQAVATLDDMIPGDVLVKYESVAASPEKKWNHVGLYLGKDQHGDQWLIESTGAHGVRLSRVREFDPRGGVRRFTLSRSVFCTEAAHNALALTPRVPKFGRLGVRQYRNSGIERFPHAGIDIYAPAGTPVLATVDGEISTYENKTECCVGLQIRNDLFCVRLGNIIPQTANVITVKKGDVVAQVSPISTRSTITYSTVSGDSSHLYLEVEIMDLAAPAPNSVKLADRVFGNHLYLSKLGVLPRVPVQSPGGQAGRQASSRMDQM